MLIIGKPKTGLRLDLAPGAWLVYRQATTVDSEAGQAAARDFFRKAREGVAALADYGLDVGEMSAVADDPALSFGVSTIVSLTEIGLRCISEWRGVADERGAALPLDRGNLCALLRDPVLFGVIQAAILGRLFEIVAEGNALKLSPNGAPAGA